MKSFLFGAVGYPLLEIAWRGRTHPCMALAGGLSTMLLHRIGRTGLKLPLQALLGGAGVTAIEAACGLMWNRRHRVWDYRRMPLNWKGQVCLPFSMAWILLSALYLQSEALIRAHRSR